MIRLGSPGMVDVRGIAMPSPTIAGGFSRSSQRLLEHCDGAMDLPVQDPLRACVELGGVEVGWGVRARRSAAGEALPQQPVGVLGLLAASAARADAVTWLSPVSIAGVWRRRGWPAPRAIRHHCQPGARNAFAAEGSLSDFDPRAVEDATDPPFSSPRHAGSRSEDFRLGVARGHSRALPDGRPAGVTWHPPCSAGVFTVERVTGIEPAWPAWKAGALPLSYTRGSPADPWSPGERVS